MPNLHSVAAHFSAQADFWDSAYQEQHVLGAIYQARLNHALAWIDAMGLPGGARVLDVGSGTGVASVALAHRGFMVDALDAAPAMLDHARANAIRAGVADRVTVSPGDVHDLPFDDATFSLILALGVIPWLASPPLALRELMRVLLPGGYLIVSTGNRNRLTFRVDPLHNQDIEILKRPMRRALARWGVKPDLARPALHSPRESLRLVADAGLLNLATASLGFGPFTFFGRTLFPERLGTRVHQRLQTLADQNTLGLSNAGTEYLVLAQKQHTEGLP
jgi:ubiquinone/menaquinone biosynthesis C-methylase UbiE